MKVPFPSLITELLDYSNDISFRDKVLRVHRKCLRQRHIALADKIEAKYCNYLPKSDMVMAQAWMMLSQKQQKDEK